MKTNNEPLTALVVDDEAVARKMLSFALEKESFSCQCATDGDEALMLLNNNEFDLVVTDLRMPNKHGHALAVELLGWSSRPAIAIHTSVLEPKVAKDLMARGVDDIVFKPTDYAAFAAKMKVLTARHKMGTNRVSAETPDAGVDVPSPIKQQPSKEDAAQPPSETPTVKKSWQSLGIEALPLSQYALEVYRMSCDDVSEAEDIASVIEREPGLTAELLRRGNSSLYNPSGEKTQSLKEIVVRIGRRHVGELALAINACTSLRDEVLPKMDVDLAWRRSLAAGIAVQLLLKKRASAENSQGLVLSAILHQLGRIVLAKTFPEDSISVMELAEQSGQALSILEKQTFGASQSEMLARLLAAWQIPSDVIEPLRYFECSYEEVKRIDKAQRDDAELVKVAVLIGWLAVGRWELWDLIEFPPLEVASRVGCLPVKQLVQQTREGLANLIGENDADPQIATSTALARVGYVNIAGPNYDFVFPFLASLGLQPVYDFDKVREKAIVNCLEASSDELYRNSSCLQSEGNVIVCRAEQGSEFCRYGTVLSLPCAHGQLVELFTNCGIASVSSDATIIR